MPRSGILHGTQLPLQQDGLALLQGFMQEGHGVRHIGTHQIPCTPSASSKMALGSTEGLWYRCSKSTFFSFTGARSAVPSADSFIEQIADSWNADLGVFVRIEGGDAATWWSRRTCRPAAPPHSCPAARDKASAPAPGPKPSAWGQERPVLDMSFSSSDEASPSPVPRRCQ